MSAELWDSYYADGFLNYMAIGEPQPALAPLIANAQNDTADVGCGLGELARAVAARGITTLGIDISDYVIGEAQQADPGGTVQWITADIMALQGYNFNTVFDSGLFNVINNTDQVAFEDYVAKIASITNHGGTWYVLLFDETYGGPTVDELNTLLSADWTVKSISPSTIFVNNDWQTPWGMALPQQTDGGYLLPANLITATRK